MANNSILDIKDILEEYSHDIQDGIQSSIEDNAKLAVKELKATSPVNGKASEHKGRYAKSWTVNTKRGRGYINCTVWNPKDYRLTHLLENGHKLKRNGKVTGIAGAKVHIAPVEEKYCKKSVSDVEKIIKNGG